uniref:Transcriptional regulator n=1 Tax=viral metagenome TaxID=1070528 RepID=A0A6M3JCM7_9ZZZZ
MRRMMEKPDDMISNILARIRAQIIILTTEKKTCKAEIVVQLNMTQGAIGDAYVSNSLKERVL